jgi:hypothetical protein
MKFFYAIIVFLLSAYIFFWSSVFIVPTPEVYTIAEITAADTTSSRFDQRTYDTAIKESNKGKDENTLITDVRSEEKRSSALFLVSIVIFFSIFFQIILFHKKSHILFPMIAGSILAYIGYSTIWMLTNTWPKEIYLDLFQTREIFQGIKAFQFLGGYIFVYVLIIVFGNWYKLK